MQCNSLIPTGFDVDDSVVDVIVVDLVVIVVVDAIVEVTGGTTPLLRLDLTEFIKGYFP